MGKVVLARVDARLIHGQVMTSLSKSAGATAIFVADDPAAHDPFTKNIILGAGSRTGLKVRVLKEDGAVRYWNDRQYDDYHVILLTKSSEVMADIIPVSYTHLPHINVFRQFGFRSTSLREARHMAQQALTKGLYLDPLASGRLDSN